MVGCTSYLSSTSCSLSFTAGCPSNHQPLTLAGFTVGCTSYLPPTSTSLSFTAGCPSNHQPLTLAGFTVDCTSYLQPTSTSLSFIVDCLSYHLFRLEFVRIFRFSCCKSFPKLLITVIVACKIIINVKHTKIYWCIL